MEGCERRDPFKGFFVLKFSKKEQSMKGKRVIFSEIFSFLNGKIDRISQNGKGGVPVLRYQLKRLQREGILRCGNDFDGVL